MAGQKECKIITVFNEKGGSGKTTTTCQLAGTLGLRGYDVLVADLDAQQTAAAWLGMNGGSDFKATIWPGFRYGANVYDEMKKLSTKYEIIVADCAPSVEQPTTWGMLLISDLALIPAKLSPPDMAALPSAKRLARRAIEECERNYPVRVIANATKLHMNDDKAFFDQLKDDKDFPPLANVMGDRKAYSRSMLYGSTVHAVKGGEDAVKEMERITDDVLNILKLSKVNKGV